MQSYIFKIQNPPVVGWRQVLCIIPSPRQSPKENKLKLRLKIYVLQCTFYARMNVHLGFEKKFFTDVPKLFWTLLGCPTTYTAAGCLPRGMVRGISSVVVSPAGRSEILKSSIPEDSNPNGGGKPDDVALQLSPSCGEGCTDRMLLSGYHTAAE